MAAKRTIVITGASSGIGRELAVQLAKPDSEIWLIARNQERLCEVAAAVQARGAAARVLALDLSDLKAAEDCLMGNFPATRRVDEVYLASAITQFGEVRDTLPEDWDLIYRTNLLSPLQWTLHFYETMIGAGAGKIVLISSLAAYAGYPTATAYATMKAGLLGLFRSIRHEGAARQIHFYLASPGYVSTNIYKTALFRNTSYEKTMELIRSLGFRVLSADDAARRILKSVRSGKREFAFPQYASLMKWLAPRMPWLIGLVHQRIVRNFRRIP